jgi:hypothetical protein
MIIKVTLFIVFLIAVAYFILKFFGKLCNIKIFSAIKWSFRPQGLKPFWPLMLGAAFFYLIAFILLWLFFYTPFQLADMKKTNVGGLSGYCDVDMQAKIYDPSKKTYVGYYHSNPPMPELRFTDAFEPVFFYQRSTVDYYQDTGLFSLSTSLIEVIIGSAMLLVVYLMLFVFGKEYISNKDIKVSLTHRFVCNQFKKTVKLSVGNALIIYLFIVMLIVAVNLISVQKIKNHYKELYTSDSEKLRSEILNTIKPTDTLQGIVFRRFYSIKSKTETTNRASDRGVKNVQTETHNYTLINYTIEFNNLIEIPVYLNLILPEGREEVIELDKNFRDNMSVIPDTLQLYPFIVNSDYSVSLIPKK